jgi:uncharacterized protein (DUF934 family)
MPNLIKPGTQGWESACADNLPYASPEEFQDADYLRLPVDAEVEPAYLSAKVIAIDFPSFNDGRGLSLAVLLRRAGFAGELRAIGNTHEDVLHYLVRCGVDAVELPDDRNVDTALGLLQPYSNYYQGSVNLPAPAFRRVERGQTA